MSAAEPIKLRCVCKRSVNIDGEPTELNAQALALLRSTTCDDLDEHWERIDDRVRTLLEISNSQQEAFLREHAATLRDNVDPALTMGLHHPWGGPVPTREWMTRALRSIVGAKD